MNRFLLAVLVVSPAAFAGPGDQDKIEAQGASQQAAAHPVLPADLRDRYRKIDLTIVGQPVVVTMKPGDIYYKNLGRMPLVNEKRVKSKLLSFTNSALKKDKAAIDAITAPVKLKVNHKIFMTVFSGKGSPEEIAVVLKLAAKFRKELRADWKEKGSLAVSLATFYETYIGLDCNGFVGNYAEAIGSKFDGGVKPIDFARPHNKRQTVDAIQPGDAMVWLRPRSHIAAVQGKRSDGTWDAIEANGERGIGGLGDTVYELKAAGKGVFKANRVRNGRKGAAQQVYVVALK